MNNWVRFFFSLLALAMSVPAFAHEYWMWPSPFSPAVNAPVHVTLHVGESFNGNLVGITNSHVKSLHHYFAGGIEDLSERVPASTLNELVLDFKRAGTHILALETHPTNITLPADKFFAYLQEEGLDSIIKMRQADGTDKKPGRERFRRNVKAMLSVAGKSDNTHAVRTGLRFEISPLVSPLVAANDRPVSFRILFDGKPLSNVLVKAWHKRDGETIELREKSDSNGIVKYVLPYTGRWMLSAVHMIAVTDSADVEWDSFWGNLTFETQVGGVAKTNANE